MHDPVRFKVVVKVLSMKGPWGIHVKEGGS